MEASTFKLKTPQITGGRSHIPLAKTEHMTIGLNYYIPGRKNKLHTHPGEEIVYVLEGSLEYQVEGRPPVTLEAGEVLFIPAGTIHAARKVGSGDAAELASSFVEKGKLLVEKVR